MHLRRVIPAVVFALLIAAAPASAATGDATPSPTPLILEVGLAVLVGIFLAVREPLGKAVAAARRRAARLLPGATAASERAPGA